MHLLGPGDRQRIRGYFLRDRGARPEYGSPADFDRGHQLRVAAHEYPVLDDGRMFLPAIVIAGDRSGADVDFFPQSGVPDVTQVVGLGASPDGRLLNLNEVANLRSLFKDRLRAKMSEGPHLNMVFDYALADHGRSLYGYKVPYLCIRDFAAGFHYAVFPPRSFAAATRRPGLNPDGY